MVRIHVGKPSIEFCAHRDLLCHYSSYFRAGLTSNFLEGRVQTFFLDTESPEIFKCFLSFLYTQKVCESKIANPAGE